MILTGGRNERKGRGSDLRRKREKKCAFFSEEGRGPRRKRLSSVTLSLKKKKKRGEKRGERKAKQDGRNSLTGRDKYKRCGREGKKSDLDDGEERVQIKEKAEEEGKRGEIC